MEYENVTPNRGRQKNSGQSSNTWHRAKYARYFDRRDNIYYCGVRQLRKHHLDLPNNYQFRCPIRLAFILSFYLNMRFRRFFSAENEAVTNIKRRRVSTTEDYEL